MAIRIAAPAGTDHPIDWGEIRGGHRIAAAIVLCLTGALFMAPPTVAILILVGLIR